MNSGRIISIEDDGDEGLRFDSYTSKRYTLAVQTMVGMFPSLWIAGKNNQHEENYYRGGDDADVCNDLAISLAAFRAIAKADNDQRFDKPAQDCVWMLGTKLNVGKEKLLEGTLEKVVQSKIYEAACAQMGDSDDGIDWLNGIKQMECYTSLTIEWLNAYQDSCEDLDDGEKSSVSARSTTATLAKNLEKIASLRGTIFTLVWVVFQVARRLLKLTVNWRNMSFRSSSSMRYLHSAILNELTAKINKEPTRTKHALGTLCKTLNEDGQVVTVTPEELVETSAKAVTFYLENGDQTEVKATTSFIYGDDSASADEL